MIYKRHFDYGVSLREFAPIPITLKGVLLYTVFEALGDIAIVPGQRRVTSPAFKWIVKSPIVRFAMRHGLYRGLRGRVGGPAVNSVGGLSSQSRWMPGDSNYVLSMAEGSQPTNMDLAAPEFGAGSIARWPGRRGEKFYERAA